jgi:hypothetical protein
MLRAHECGVPLDDCIIEGCIPFTDEFVAHRDAAKALASWYAAPT